MAKSPFIWSSSEALFIGSGSDIRRQNDGKVVAWVPSGTVLSAGNFSYERVISTQTITIEEHQQMVVRGEFINSGIVLLSGTIAII